LKLDSNLEDAITFENTLFSGGASRLLSLELIGGSFRPPVGAVKYLKLFRPFLYPLLSYDQLSQLFRPIRSLTHFTTSANLISDAENHSPIELPSVLSLEIYFDHHDTSSSTFTIFDFPAVKFLTIHGSTNVTIRTLTRNHRVYPHVQSFTLVEKYGDAENVPAALALDFIALLPRV
jgi:hypothetical protein